MNLTTDRRHRFARVGATLVAAVIVQIASAATPPKDLFADVAPAWAVRPEHRNAALIYLSAELSRIDRAALAIADAGEKDTDTLGTTLDAARLPKEFEAARAAINPDLVARIRGATRLARCDFEIEYEKGYLATMPNLQNMRNAARVLRIDTRIALTEPTVDGNGERASENLAAMYRVARDTAAMRTMISSLVAQRVLDLAVRETRVYLKSPLSTTDGRRVVLAAAQELGDDPMRKMDAMETEEAMLQAFLRRAAAAKAPGDALAKAMVEMGHAPDSKPVAQARRATRKDLDAAIAQASELFAGIRAEWSTPRTEQTSNAIELKVAALGANSVLHFFLPASDAFHRKCVETEGDLAAVLAELAAHRATESDGRANLQLDDTGPNR